MCSTLDGCNMQNFHEDMGEYLKKILPDTFSHGLNDYPNVAPAEYKIMDADAVLK